MSGRYEQALRSAAELACDKSAEYAGQRLKSLSGGRRAFYPNVYPDEARFSVGVVERYEYLVYLERGFETFAMSALRGKTIPMLINGQLIFRKATKINRWRSGTKSYWRRGADGELVESVEQSRSWVHPGVAPRNFIKDACIDAARESAQDMYEALVADLEEEWVFDDVE